MGCARSENDGQSAPLNAPIVKRRTACDGEFNTYAGERDDTALFVLYKTGGDRMTKTISDETREYFCYIKQKVRKGEKVIPWLSGTKRKRTMMYDTAKAIAKCVEAMEAAIEQTKKCITATEEANKIIISQSGLDAILAAVKDYYERIRELETDININVDGGTPKSTDLLLVKGGTPFTTDYDKYIAGTSHTI